MNWEFLNEEVNGYKKLISPLKRPGFLIDHGPIIGIESFGIIDYGTNVLVVRPNTSCLLDCAYCYVWESKSNKKDFLVHYDLILKELRNIINIKKHRVEVHIDSEGDFLLYPWIKELLMGLKRLNVRITIDNHGYLLSKELIDLFRKIGIDRLNIVLNTLKQERVRKIYGVDFDLEKYLELVKYAANRINVTIAPIIIPRFNLDELRDIIKWVKKNIPRHKYPRIIPQNYLVYSNGKKPIKPLPFPGFIQLLQELENELREKLWINFEEDLDIHRDERLPRVFHKDEEIDAEIILPGRWPSERIAMARNRLIMVKGTRIKLGKKVRVKITHSFNTYEAVLV